MLEDKFIKQSQLSNSLQAEVTNDIPQPTQPGGYPVLNMNYTQGIMKKLVGYLVEVEFLIGTDNKVVKKGYLSLVGVNYFLIYDIEDELYVSCDLYSITFIYFGMEYDPQYIRQDEAFVSVEDESQTGGVPHGM